MNLKLACAPANWSNDDLPSLGGHLTYQQCLSEMALAGFTGSEGGGKFPKELNVIKRALDLRGMTICNMWFTSEFTAFKTEDTIKRFEEHMDYTYALGARVVGVGECGVAIHGNQSMPLIAKRPILSDEQFKALADGMNELGRRANDKGMKVCLHHHVGTGVQTLDEIDRFMDMTDSNLVYLLYDTGHLALAGEDPVKAFKKYVSRTAHIHMKDLRRSVYDTMVKEDWPFLKGVLNGIFSVPGDGDVVDWDGVFEILSNSDYDGWAVLEAEQDPDIADPLEYAMITRKFLQKKMGI